MINKFWLVIFILFVGLISSKGIGLYENVDPSIIDSFYFNNKEQLIEILKYSVNENLSKELERLPKESWIKRREEIFNTVSKSFLSSEYKEYRNRPEYMRNSSHKSIMDFNRKKATFLISLLDFPSYQIKFIETDKKMQLMNRALAQERFHNTHEWVKKAVELLVYSTDLTIIKENSELIKKKLIKCKWGSSKKKKGTLLTKVDKYKLVVLTELNEKEKLTVINDVIFNYLPLWTKARLGDTASENKLIRRYESERRFIMKKQLLKFLVLSGTDKSLYSVLNSFSLNLYDDSMVRYVTPSFRYEIIEELSRIHINDITFYEAIKVLVSDRELVCDKNRAKTEIKKFLKWVKKEYKIDIPMSDSQMHMSIDNTDGGWWCSKNREKILREKLEKKNNK